MNARKSWYWENVRHAVEGKSLREMWDTCEDGEWLLWFVAHMVGKPGWPSHQQVVLAACQCARLALRHVEADEKRPLMAINAAEVWANGYESVEHVSAAGEEVDRSKYGNTAAYFAAEAAKGAAWAVHVREDGDSFRFAQAASTAISSTKSAAGYEILDTRGYSHREEATQAEKDILRECADIVRQMLNVPDDITNELPIYNWIKRWDRNIKKQKTGRMIWIPIAVSRSGPKVYLNGTEVDRAKLKPELRVFQLASAFSAIIALIFALQSNPSHYYVWLRWITFTAVCATICRGYIQGSCKWAYILFPIAILFNPLFQVHIHADRLDVLKVWYFIDISTAIIFGLITILVEVDFSLLKKYGETLSIESKR